MTSSILATFIEKQLSEWSAAAERFRQLEQDVQTRFLTEEGVRYAVQWNPARIVSTKALTDTTQQLQRPCFLCAENQVKEQFGLPYIGHTRILINPFPILRGHLVIAKTTHEEQCFSTLSESIYSLATDIPEYVFFYNGARSGASAPDHAHYQGGLRGTIPLERDFHHIVPHSKALDCIQGVTLYHSSHYIAPLYYLQSSSKQKDTHKVVVERFLHTLPKERERKEADFNLFVWKAEETLITVIIPRRKHRPACFYDKGEKQCLVSPGAIDMGGLLITPQEKDFKSMTLAKATALLQEVGGLPLLIGSQEPQLRVGIIHKKEIHINFLTPYLYEGEVYEGKHTFVYSEQQIDWNKARYPFLNFYATTPQAKFKIENVTIGIHFHWEKEEAQIFEGDLSIIIEQESLTAVNHIRLENYLTSVISSEMNPNAPLSFLKAHAIISRSWVLNQLQRRTLCSIHNHAEISPTEHIVWYDSRNHLYYDICADDHCQRYQGLQKEIHPAVAKALEATQGEVLWSGESVCDARFSKCCGGVTEAFSTCWEEKDFSYLAVNYDRISPDEQPLNYQKEATARSWISSTNNDFCHTKDQALLTTILKDYDQQTSDFYRWKVTVTQEEIQQWLQEKLSLQLGAITALVPLERGQGGRIKRLKIEGTASSFVVGKELEIRRLLSSTHLYSSAFYVETFPCHAPVPTHFTLIGAGWGHGVGLCQIGAAVMGAKGYDYQTILLHYYRGATLKRIY